MFALEVFVYVYDQVGAGDGPGLVALTWGVEAEVAEVDEERQLSSFGPLSREAVVRRSLLLAMPPCWLRTRQRWQLQPWKSHLRILLERLISEDFHRCEVVESWIEL